MIPDNLLDKVHCIDALALLKMLPDESVNCIVTSPPYFGLRDYGTDGQIGLEDTPRAFVDRLVTVFAEARRVLRSDGVLWVNMGDTYTGGGRGGNPPLGAHWKQGTNAGSVIESRTDVEGLPAKSRLGIPHRLVFALQDDGWIWRDEIIWAKPNPMPESVTDRTTKAHEFVFMLTKEPRYWYDNEAIKEDAVNGDPNSPRGSYGVLGQKNAGNRFRNSTRYLNQGVAPSNTSHSGILTETKMTLESRNRRSIWTVAEPTVKLRSDLTPEKRAYVVSELIRRGLI